MSMEKAIKYGKEKRKSYNGVKRIDKQCRNHGSCSWCNESRQYNNLKKETEMKDKREEYDKRRNVRV